VTPGEIYRTGDATKLLYKDPPHGPGHTCAECRSLDQGRVKLAAAITGVGMDFGISMRDEVLTHKRRDGRQSEGRYCFWTFTRGVPDGIAHGSRMWVANHGRWVGYFMVDCIEPDADWFKGGMKGKAVDREVHFYSESFVQIDGGPRTPFMGYTFVVPSREP
jgi:hypothetical protein